MRCDLGSVDDPHDPPCVRCRRESKECFFSATRRKRRAADGSDEIPDFNGSGNNNNNNNNNNNKNNNTNNNGDAEYELRNSRKRLRVSDTAAEAAVGALRPASRSTASTALPNPLTPGGSVGQLQPLRRPGSQDQSSISPQAPPGSYPSGRYAASGVGTGGTPADTGVEDQRLTAEKLLHTEVYSGHDALNLLFEAAGRSGDIVRARDESQPQVKASPVAAQGSSGSQTLNGSSVIVGADVGATRPYAHLPDSKREVPNVPIDPAISDARRFQVSSRPNETEPAPAPEPGPEPDAERAALRAWSRCRFVRAGWFTAREAIEYIE